MVILIPAYEPDERLLELIVAIQGVRPGYRIVVVNDGSGPRYAPIFDGARRLGCHVVTHHSNRGKGYALRRGFGYVAANLPGEDVVTADCDGQHAVIDILRVAAAVESRRNTIVLGSRRFVGAVPLRSRFGNSATRRVFSLLTGLRIGDTQTGLRGYPGELLGWLRGVVGNRFEYELMVLLDARKLGLAIHEIPIDTIYLDGNRSSHFRPIVDSLRIYLPLLRFGVSSLSAFLLDFLLLFVVKALTGSLLGAVVSARACSATFNYAANRNLVFRRGRDTRVSVSAAKYFALAALVMAGNYALLYVLHERIGMALVLAKLATEASLFGISYQTQKRFIFTGGGAVGSANTTGIRVGSLESVTAHRPD